jgi:hypothetical protein
LSKVKRFKKAKEGPVQCFIHFASASQYPFFKPLVKKPNNQIATVRLSHHFLMAFFAGRLALNSKILILFAFSIVLGEVAEWSKALAC